MPVPKNQSNLVLSGTLTSAPTNGVDQLNPVAKGAKFVIDVTAFAGTSITFTVQGKDPVSGKYYTVLVTAPLTTTGTTVLNVYPGIVAAANLAVNDILPRDYRVISAGTFSGTTFTVTASLVT